MTQQKDETAYSRAMVVVAHPDDAEFGCSGTVAKWCRLGWEVVYVLCTDGSKGTDDRNISSEQLAEIRKQEQIDAGKVLGLKTVEFLGYPDGYLQPSLELRKDISREIRRHKPDILITTNPRRDLLGAGYIGHPDHFAAGEAAMSAVYPAARDHLTFPELLEEGFEPHKVREVWVTMFGEDATRFNPLDEVDVETSIRALHAHTSQIKNPDGAAEGMRKRRAEIGAKVGAPYAEAFRAFKLS
jgi:LmbE family N-acetylglucosaminyl deacetylase